MFAYLNCVVSNGDFVIPRLVINLGFVLYISLDYIFAFFPNLVSIPIVIVLLEFNLGMQSNPLSRKLKGNVKFIVSESARELV